MLAAEPKGCAGGLRIWFGAGLVSDGPRISRCDRVTASKLLCKLVPCP